MTFNVSFIIPAYNEEKSIEKCINSIKSILEQQRFNKSFNMEYYVDKSEIIVVDNMSTDNTAEIAKKTGATVVKCYTQGITHARDIGYHSAKYNLQAYIDADTIIPFYYPWIIEALDAFVDPNVVAVSGPFKYLGKSELFNSFVSLFYGLGRFLSKFIGPMLQGGNFVVRKQALDKIGGMPTDIEFYGEDAALAKRLSKFGKVITNKNMVAYTSPRRLKGDGVISTSLRYSINYAWIHWFDTPFSKKHKDYRE